MGGIHLKPRVYPNGFIFSDKIKKMDKVPQHFTSKCILNNYTYIYDELSHYRIYEHDNQFIIIHGLFIYLDLDRGNLTEKSCEILMEQYFRDKNEFLESLNFCGGRFTIIIGTKNNFEVYTDASAMRTVYVEVEKNIVTSHINLLQDVYNLSDQIKENLPLAFTRLWDTTAYKNVKSINPNFYYTTKLNNTVRYYPFKENKYIGMDFDEKLRIFEFLWKEQLKYFKKQYESVIFSITGGADSRVSLALAKNYINDFQFFTYAPTTRVSGHSSHFLKSLSKDKEIVDQMLDVIPLKHNYLLFQEDKRTLTDEEVSILNKNSPYSHGRFLLPHYNYYFPKNSTLHIRGNLFEIGRAYFIGKNSNNNRSDVYKIVYQSMKKHFTDKTDDNFIKEEINKFIERFNYDENNFNYHVLDLYYWEIRMGRWMAEVLNETDFCFETLLPFNMKEIMDISLSFSIPQRKNNYLFNELINRNYPILNFFGKNDVRNIYEQNKDRKSMKYIESFSVYTSQGKKTRDIITSNNEIYNPKENMNVNHYSEVQFTYSVSRGNLKLILFGKYKNNRAKDYFKYQILINDNVKLEEDIALWNQETDILITGLRKNDKIQLRIISNKKSMASSWEKASTITVLEYKEIYSKEVLPLNVYSNSPIAKIINI